MVGVLENPDNKEQCDLFYDESVRKKIKACKSNIMGAASYKYYGLSGECYTVGNKANYGLVNNSSVSTFTKKSRMRVGRYL